MKFTTIDGQMLRSYYCIFARTITDFGLIQTAFHPYISIFSEQREKYIYQGVYCDKERETE
jgi:hypothetical protein